MNEYMVTFSVSGTMLIDAKSEADAKEQALALTNEEIIQNVEVALESDSYHIGDIEIIEK